MTRSVRHAGERADRHGVDADHAADVTTRTLTAAADALADANQQVERLDASRRALTATLAGMLHCLPLAIVLSDGKSVRACSDVARAEGIRPGGPLDPLGPAVALAVEELVDQQAGSASVIGGRWRAARLDTESGDPAQVLLFRLPEA